VARYTVLNPVRAQMVRSAGDWPWSSYRATAGRTTAPSWLTTDWILSAFAGRAGDAQIAYRQFVSDGRGQPAPWEALAYQVFLGDDAFVDAMHARIEQHNRPLAEIPRSQRAGRARPIADYEKQSYSRDQAIAAAYASGGYTMQEVGAHFGLHYSRVSRIVRDWERKAKRKT
jgi:hypothetical protein